MKSDQAIAPVRWGRSLKKFVKEASQELRKVQWPGSDEIKAYTYLVLFVLGVTAAWVGILEFVCLQVAERVNLYGTASVIFPSLFGS